MQPIPPEDYRATTRDCPYNGDDDASGANPYHCRGNPLWLPCAEAEEHTQHDAPAATTDAPPAPSPESALPPEAQGEAHGGPLGCCLGTVIGLLLTTLLITAGSLALANGGFLGGATLPIVLLGAIVGGSFGWRVGKKIYKEYEPPIIKQRRPQAIVKPKAKRS